MGCHKADVAEQTARRPARERPSCSEWHLLGFTIWGTERVAAGEVELGLIVIPNIVSVPGAELVGPIPPELQSYIVFTAAVSAQSSHQQTARDLIKRLTSPDTVPFIKAKGMEPG